MSPETGDVSKYAIFPRFLKSSPAVFILYTQKEEIFVEKEK